MRRLHLVAAIALATTSCSAAHSGNAASAAGTETSSTERTTNVKEKTVMIDGVAFHYQVYGDIATSKARPVLLLHGAYMTADGMKDLATRLAKTRPVIVPDQRGHGRTGDVPGPITYEKLADDAALIIKAAGVQRADVFGYSMGAGTAILLAVRHPEVVAHLVEASGSFQSSGMYPEVTAGMEKMTPEAFAGTPIEKDYKRLAPDPSKFPELVKKLTALDTATQNWPESAIKAIKSPTMIISGDYDIIRPEHSLELYRLRGGGSGALSAAGFLTAPPPARLAILPATGHLGVISQPDLLVALVLPFLDDVAPGKPKGFI